MYRSAYVQGTLNLLNNGPKAQEQRCWHFRYAKEKPQSASLVEMYVYIGQYIAYRAQYYLGILELISCG